MVKKNTRKSKKMLQESTYDYSEYEALKLELNKKKEEMKKIGSGDFSAISEYIKKKTVVPTNDYSEYEKLKIELDEKKKQQQELIQKQFQLAQGDISPIVDKVWENKEFILEKKDEIFDKYAQLQEELKSKKRLKKQEEENLRQEAETKQLENLENLFDTLQEVKKEDEKEIPIVVEKAIVEPEKETVLIGDVVELISKQVENLDEVVEQKDSADKRIAQIEKELSSLRNRGWGEYLGGGSGEVRILNMDDVDTTDLANNKILSYNSSSGKFVFASASSGGSKHTVQNAGSDLTARSNLNFHP